MRQRRQDEGGRVLLILFRFAALILIQEDGMGEMFEYEDEEEDDEFDDEEDKHADSDNGGGGGGGGS
eukprot:11155342-Karenia_brevis.AAC.1